MEGFQFDADAFLRDSKARLKFRYSHLIKPVFDGFDALLAEPEDYQALWTFDVDQMEFPARKADPDDGLVIRRGEKNADPLMPAYDVKAVMQYTERVPYLLESRGVDMTRHLPFLEACAELLHANKTAALAMAKAIDARKGSRLFPAILRSTEHRMRLLCYPPQAEGTVIGKKHKDRCDWTIHMAEDFPACHVKGELIEAKDDDAFVFASSRFEQHMGGLVPTAEAQEHEIKVPPGSPWANRPRHCAVTFIRSDR